MEAAYWTDVGNREHLRWVLPYDEEPLLDALARLHVAGTDHRRRGLPAGRDVPRARPAGPGLGPALGHRRGGRWRSPAARFGEALDAALADGSPLTGDERAARSGLANRQLTIR